MERIKTNVDKKTGDAIRNLELDGVKVDEDFKRYYPYIYDLPSGRLDLTLTFVKCLCFLLIIFCIKNHQIYKSSHHATNKTVCTISVIHSQVKEPETVVAELSKALEMDEGEVRKKVEKVSSMERS